MYNGRTSTQDAQQHLDALKAAGVRVWDRVDCTRLHLDRLHFPVASPSSPSPPPYDVVVFNFPHTGCGIADTDANVQHHRAFLSSFLASLLSSPLAHPSLTLHITLKTGEPYTSWRLPTLLPRTFPLRFRTSFPFHSRLYEGYIHRRTRGWREDDGDGEDNGDISDGATTFEWRMWGEEATPRAKGPPLDEVDEAVERRGRRAEEEAEELEAERRALQEEVRRVVSRYDVTGETTLPAASHPPASALVAEVSGTPLGGGAVVVRAGGAARSRFSKASKSLSSAPAAAETGKDVGGSKPPSSSARAPVALAPLPPRPQQKSLRLHALLF